jgi:outer membrane protein assembly factor BamA
MALWSQHATAQSKGDDGQSETHASKHELTILPTAGGTSDIGFGGGYVASLARLGPRVEPYWWRIESAGAFTLKENESGKLGANYIDDYVLLDFPNVLKNRLGLKVRLSYTREKALKFYGLGNAAQPDPATPSRELDYTRNHPTLRFDGEAHFLDYGRLYWGAAYTYNWFVVDADSLLARTMRNGSTDEKVLLGNAAPHGVATFTQGLGWDRRDEITSPHRGHFHDAHIDLSPGNGSEQFRYRFARVSGTARFYVPLVFERLTLAVRFVGDALFGDVPFYELARYQDSYALGGSKGVRGVPGQRYHGKLKLFSNVELRSELVHFQAFNKSNVVGLTGFFDSGRIWADYSNSATLDGSGIGLKYGTGGGLRWAAGKSFVLRFDVAWSPDANPVGAYLAAGQMF